MESCAESEFFCNVTTICISLERVCNGINDCGGIDDSDERDCREVNGCHWTQNTCRLGNQCIPRNKICDGKKNCEDGSDEERCDDGSRCHWSKFQCHDKSECIPGYFYCDDVTQCSDGSDEINCLNDTLKTNTGTLAPYWYSLLGNVIILGIPLIILYRKYRRRSFIPYNQEFEIKWKDLIILEDQKLGEGAFGIVFKGQLAGHSTL
ncbi:unnamed protein product [Allacma fusca]|uniref:Uncharacterized protein n=1 Tax=Allacma fusca TaxID=39272 RepID=A0A8J2K1N9_9HEXA|nr:unnamed protein product [Allacma fusca]